MTKEQLLEVSKPLICNTEVAKAFADGRKTQTRRLSKLKNQSLSFSNFQGFDKLCALFEFNHYNIIRNDSNSTRYFK